MSTPTPGPGGTATPHTFPLHNVLSLPGDFLLSWGARDDVKLWKRLHGQDDGHRLTGGAVRVSPSTIAELQTSFHLEQTGPTLRTVAVAAPQSALQEDLRTAMAAANGRVKIVTFPLHSATDAAAERAPRVVKELSPKYLRGLNGVAWNPAPEHDHMLAAGYDKIRNDAGLLVFDTRREASVSTVAASLTSRFSLTRGGKSEFVWATTEIGVGETCHSLAWLPGGGQPDCILAGMNGKSLKVFDLRLTTPDKTAQSNFTRAVHGVCVDPFMDTRIASMSDSSIFIWDTRSFEKPIVTLHQANRVQHLQWCPNRGGLLCSVTTGSESLNIHDIQSWTSTTELEPAVTERTVKSWVSKQAILHPAPSKEPSPPIASSPSSGSAAASPTSSRPPTATGGDVLDPKRALSSFSWLQENEHLIMGVTMDGTLTEVEVTERIAPSWGADHCLTWPHGGELQVFDSDCPLFTNIQDVSPLMQKRAETDYGACDDLKGNNEFLLEKSPSIEFAWSWLSECQRLMKDLAFRNRFSKHVTFPGVRTALGIDGVGAALLPADIRYVDWNNATALSDGGPVPTARKRKIYKNSSRESAQRLCGWNMDASDLAAFVERCETAEEYSRAAAVAVFCMELRMALRILERGSVALQTSSPATAAQLNMTAMSLAGFSEDKNSLWRELVGKSMAKLEDPYLRAMFAFLLVENEDYSAVLSEPGLKLSDKVAFRCQFYSNEQLISSLNRTWEELLQSGDLQGLFMCGMSEDGLELIQRFLDVTGDVQTVSWLVVRCLPPVIGKESEAVKEWLESYRSLLDSWELYYERAEFDSPMYKSGVLGDCRPKQVYVSCNFCGSSVAQHLKGLPKEEDSAKSAMNKQAKSKVRVQSCPACKKQLPRCAVCLITMGSYSGLLLTGQPPPPDAPPATPFEDFFSWCQTCRHGGHAGHMAEWFQSHDACPLSGCGCKCWSVDPVALAPAESSEPQQQDPPAKPLTKKLVNPLGPLPGTTSNSK